MKTGQTKKEKNRESKHVFRKTGKRLRVQLLIQRALAGMIAMVMASLIFTSFGIDGNGGNGGSGGSGEYKNDVTGGSSESGEYKNGTTGNAGIADGSQPEAERFIEAANESQSQSQIKRTATETFYTGPGLII